jgi:LysM repeat protein
MVSTTPMTAAKFASVLRAAGVTVVEIGNWETHNRNHIGAWGPVYGVMIHHTVTSGSARTVQICRDGYSGLPGPLCHGVITKDGKVHLVGYGRANHAGSGDADVLAAVRAGRPAPQDNQANTDGNRAFYGFECENMGNGTDPWPAAQLLAIERVSAAICKHHGWNEHHVIGHLEWQPGKIDPRGFTMSGMRAKVAKRMTAITPAPGARTHTVARGDTLWSIGRRYGVTVDTLRRLNPWAEGDLITPGDKITVSGTPAPGVRIHTVVKGDTLWAIARKYSTTVDKIRKLNPAIKDSNIGIGDKITVSGSVATVVRTHTVARGDTLWSIGQRYKVTVDRLRQLNPSVKGDEISPGDKVRYQ